MSVNELFSFRFKLNEKKKVLLIIWFGERVTRKFLLEGGGCDL